ncbi:MAG: tRNA 4-thiouridine(8) synthase ThiI [Deltaproteobacteria bacterium]|nr:tRNA 4-thiouridine(8) synthase ThiI [Deltaproteobacteria bacterium]
MKKLIVIRYSEIALKGKNRHWFEDTLVRNIHQQVSPVETIKIYKIHGRIIIEPVGNIENITSILNFIPGIANYSIAYQTSHDLAENRAISKSMMQVFMDKTDQKTVRFKVESRRAEKSFPMNSIQLSQQIGGDLLQEFEQLSVDLHQPEISLGIEIWQKDRCIVFLEKINGQGGLPVGTAGTVLSFLSGGIDSPVASWFMMKRGCKVIYLHFHSYPFTGEQSRQKVVDLATHLSRYQPKTTLLIVPFTDIQKAIKENCQERYRTILYRRFMYYIGNQLIKKYKALGYVTGEAVGQVASQTLENLACTEDAAAIPVLRPLIGMEKAEIISYSKLIGTFEISIQPFPDCCTVFQPRKPEVHGNIKTLQKEEQFDYSNLIQETIAAIESITIDEKSPKLYW